MELQLWNAIVQIINALCKCRCTGHFLFSDADILKVWFWAVIHDRPISWSTDSKNWPIHLRSKVLPSNATMCRRLRSRSILAIMRKIETRVIAPKCDSLCWIIDGKPLPIGGCSKDRQAGYGRAAGCKARGYKLHALVGKNGAIAAWRVAPMNKDERVMAHRILKVAPINGYVTADSNYDSNKLHDLCATRESLQLISPRRRGKQSSLGHRKHSPGRLRSKEILEAPFNDFGQDLMSQRSDIERKFAWLTNWGGGLTHLPPWARTYRRVHRWVQAKLVIAALKNQV